MVLTVLGSMIVGAVIGILVVGASFKWDKTPIPTHWKVECGHCHAEREAGPRRQLYLEVWDSYGNMYEKFPVGAGELLNTRLVDAALMMDVRRVVGRINAQTEAEA